MASGRLITGDCVKLLPKIRQGSIDLAVIDPPFNMGKEYDSIGDDLSRKEYLTWTEAWLAVLVPTLKDAASVFVAIADEFAAEVKVRADAAGLHMRNWIVWHYTFGCSTKRKFARSHTHVLYFVRDPKNFHFDAGAVKVPSARQRVYKDRRAAHGGKVPDDVWVLRPEEEDSAYQEGTDTWHLPRVCGTFKERVRHQTVGHPCQMPEAVLERIVGVASRPGDTVLDPMCGTGTTLVAAKRLGRNYLGIDLSSDYVSVARGRLEGVA